MKPIILTILFFILSGIIYCSATGIMSKYYGLVAGIGWIVCLFGFGTINNYEKIK